MPKIPVSREKLLKIDDDVSLVVGGKIYQGWKDISISKSLTSIAHSFSLNVIDRWRQGEDAWPLKPGLEVQFFIGKKSVSKGYIDSLNVNVSNTSHSISISGRSKTGDLVDCSIDSEQSEFKNIDLTGLANKLVSPFGIAVKDESTAGGTFDKFSIKQGESVFEALERAVRQKGALLISDELGNIIITNRGTKRAFTQLVQGINVKNGSANYDMTDRFSKYIVKGQVSGTDDWEGTQTTESTATATDSGISRNRPIVIVAENAVSQADAKDRAKWEATFRAAKGQSINVSVQGWLMSDGNLWDINQIAHVHFPFLGIRNINLLINSVTFKKDNSGGTVTDLELIREDAFDPKENISKEKDPVDNLGWD